jgi:hypothetical protein
LARDEPDGHVHLYVQAWAFGVGVYMVPGLPWPRASDGSSNATARNIDSSRVKRLLRLGFMLTLRTADIAVKATLVEIDPDFVWV